MGFKERNEKHEQAKRFLIDTQPLKGIIFSEIGRETNPVYHAFLISMGDDNPESDFLRHFPDVTATRLSTKKSIFLDLKPWFRLDTQKTSSEVASTKAMNMLRQLNFNTGYLLYRLTIGFEFFFVKELVLEDFIHNGSKNGSGTPFQCAPQCDQKVCDFTELYECLS